MITTHRPGIDEYAASFADYVDRVADDEDIAGVLGYATPLPSFDDQARVAEVRAGVLEERYTE
jgi:hypothetical protein